ncbi:MAG TPA: hypothetical protein VHK67_08000 [Rhabdochlamydiaceae bacterium]|jgi:hypothetical protein|nr:hypothetical protein [Rhabdochlamydiaceae bacterium]
MAKKKRGRITVLEAVDNLSHLADLDVEKKEKTEWTDPAKVEENQDAIRETFKALTSYLQHLYQKERTELGNPQTQKGLQAMMQLAGEAVDKVGKYTKLFKGVHHEAIPEFQQLQQFYLSKVFSRVKQERAAEHWEVEGAEGELEDERQALKDLEAVQQDDEYELFYISKEDGTPFFTPELLRHIRMVGNFDESLMSRDREDVLRRMEVILDRDLHVSAQEILQEAADLIDRFYKEALNHREQEGPAALCSAVMALMLSANPKNMMHNSHGKSSVHYFIDFEMYLRKVLETGDYNHWRTLTPEKLNSFKTVCLKLSHYLCNALFLRSGARHEIMSFIRDVVENTAVELPTLWGTLSSIETALRNELRKSPSGPLMKILKVFRYGEEKKGFDPLIQKNPPSHIFNLSSETTHTSIVHLPCPIHQEMIDRVSITPEFKGYLRSLVNRKHLYINLQDRTSWKEHARSSVMEGLSKEGEFTEVLQVVTLPVHTDFYYQINDYAEVLKAKDFCTLCIEQINGGTECGFFYPVKLLTPKIIEGLVGFVYSQFFHQKPGLSRKERLDFIQILYFFLILRIIDAQNPDVLSFSDKDGVDIGAAMAASFYGFARMISTMKPWTEEDKNFFLFAFFGPALLIRHRSIAPLQLQRTLSALDHFEITMGQKRDSILKACAALFPDLPLTQIKVSEVA